MQILVCITKVAVHSVPSVKCWFPLPSGWQFGQSHRQNGRQNCTVFSALSARPNHQVIWSTQCHLIRPWVLIQVNFDAIHTKLGTVGNGRCTLVQDYSIDMLQSESNLSSFVWLLERPDRHQWQLRHKLARWHACIRTYVSIPGFMQTNLTKLTRTYA